MVSKKFLATCAMLTAASALQMDHVTAESQVGQQLTNMLSGLGPGNMLNAGVSQNGSPTASVNFFGLTANAGANPLGQVQASAGLSGMGADAQASRPGLGGGAQTGIGSLTTGAQAGLPGALAGLTGRRLRAA